MTGGREAPRPDPAGGPLIAALAAPEARSPDVLALAAPSWLQVPAPTLLPLLPPLQSVQRLPQLAMLPGGSATRGELRVEGRVLAARERLGPLLDRQMREFPLEIDSPVRLRERVVARYPFAGVPDAEEATVTVWAVVDAEGKADEIEVVEGPAELTEAVIAAVRAARFTPAYDRLQPIRFPIALEFRFAAGARSGEVASTGAR
jgi:hypothetical protein